MKYEFLDHTADLKFRARGKSLNEAFENVVLAFSEIIRKENKIKLNVTKKIKVEGRDKENLLYNFIDELIYLLDAEGFVVGEGKIIIRRGKERINKVKILNGGRGEDNDEAGRNLILEAELMGDKVDNYKGLDHIKAATYAEMYVRKIEGRKSGKIKVGKGWEVQAVVDV